MTKEQKELLLKDLCARLPYNTIVHGVYAHQNQDFDTESDYIAYKEMDNILTVLDIEWIQMCAAEVKPYLFPMSSMTEEQEKELKKVYSDEADLIAEHLKSDISGNIHTHRFNHQLSLNWYLKNHFDINGLIPMGLAIDATNLNIY